jgi:glycosyltransferase involved in cell wall biosynthesis
VRLESGDRPVFYPLAPAVELVSLDLQAASAGIAAGAIANLRRIVRLRATLARLKPDRIVGFGTETNVLALLAAGGRWPVIAAERCDPDFYPASRLWRRLRNWTYPRAAKVVLQTAAARGTLSARLNSVVIPNPVPVPPPAQPADPRPAPTGLVAMGRLTHQKGFDVLLDALARLPARHGATTLRILGDGEARDDLAAQAACLGVAGRVEMPGVVAAPAAYLRAATIFVLPSRYEGFPNALCEAMALGLPVIASDCPSGPAEIVHNGIDGLLVPPDDASALSDAIVRLLDDAGMRNAMAARATAITRTLSEDSIFAMWRSAL